MSRASATTLSLLLILFAACAAQAASWRAYHNPRFGVSARIPPGWTENRPGPANGDGAAFTSPDKRGTISVSGIFSVSPIADEFAERAKPDDGGVIAYSQRGPNWIIASWTKGDQIIYRKSIFACNTGVWNDLDIEYPVADKARYDSIVKQVAASLKASKGADYLPSMCK